MRQFIKVSRFSLIMSLLFIFPLCKFDLAKELNMRIRDPMDDNMPIRVLFSTNRKTAYAIGCTDSHFGIELGNAMQYGSCEIFVPKKHLVGSLPDGPERGSNFQFGNFESLAEGNFFSILAGSPDPEILLFVHGFNVKFEEAVFRAAQIKYDVKFQGPIVLLSWPAGSGDGLFDGLLMNKTYTANQINAQTTIAPAGEFLEKLTNTGKKIHLIIHSMGHQVILPGIVDSYRRNSKKLFGEIIMNAPDFPIEEFKTLTPQLLKAADRLTLYCSPGDNALLASFKINGSRRIGMCALVDGIDVINVNEIDDPALGILGLGHGYYSGRAILGDLYQVLLGIEARKRLFIRRSDPGGQENFVLRR